MRGRAAEGIGRTRHRDVDGAVFDVGAGRERGGVDHFTRGAVGLGGRQIADGALVGFDHDVGQLKAGGGFGEFEGQCSNVAEFEDGLVAADAQAAAVDHVLGNAVNFGSRVVVAQRSVVALLHQFGNGALRHGLHLDGFGQVCAGGNLGVTGGNGGGDGIDIGTEAGGAQHGADVGGTAQVVAAVRIGNRGGQLGVGGLRRRGCARGVFSFHSTGGHADQVGHLDGGLHDGLRRNLGCGARSAGFKHRKGVVALQAVGHTAQAQSCLDGGFSLRNLCGGGVAAQAGGHGMHQRGQRADDGGARQGFHDPGEFQAGGDVDATLSQQRFASHRCRVHFQHALRIGGSKLGVSVVQGAVVVRVDIDAGILDATVQHGDGRLRRCSFGATPAQTGRNGQTTPQHGQRAPAQGGPACGGTRCGARGCAGDGRCARTCSAACRIACRRRHGFGQARARLSDLHALAFRDRRVGAVCIQFAQFFFTRQAQQLVCAALGLGLCGLCGLCGLGGSGQCGLRTQQGSLPSLGLGGHSLSRLGGLGLRTQLFLGACVIQVFALGHGACCSVRFFRRQTNRPLCTPSLGSIRSGYFLVDFVVFRNKVNPMAMSIRPRAIPAIFMNFIL